jgi:hypothetical protein
MKEQKRNLTFLSRIRDHRYLKLLMVFSFIVMSQIKMVIITTNFVDQNIYHSSQMAKYPPRTLEIRLKISSVSHTGSMVSAGCYRAKDLEPFSSA